MITRKRGCEFIYCSCRKPTVCLILLKDPSDSAHLSHEQLKAWNPQSLNFSIFSRMEMFNCQLEPQLFRQCLFYIGI